MKNIIQYGSEHQDYTNDTGAAIVSGQMVNMGNGKVGLATTDIAIGGVGALITKNVIAEVPKAAGGALTKGEVPAIGTAGNTVAKDTTALVTIQNAYMYAAALSSATTAQIVLD